MRFVVAIKQVPDTENMAMNDDGTVDRTGVRPVMDPYSEYALRRILESKRDGDTVSVVTMGPPQAESVLRRCVALGADSACLLSDPAFAGADVWATARVLASYMQKFECGYDCMVFGRMSSDGETGQLPFEVAGLLDVEQHAYVTDLRRDGDSMISVQDYGDVVRECSVGAGAVIAFAGVDPNGTFMDVPGFLASLESDIVTRNRVDLGLGLYSVGSKGSPTSIRRIGTVGSTRRNRKVLIKDPRRAADLVLGELEAME